MQLNVLARGDVQDLVAVLLGEVGHQVELIGGDSPVRDLDAQHPRRVPQGLRTLGQLGVGVLERAGGRAVMALPVVIALAVGAATKPGLGEHAVLHLALAA